MNSKDFKYKELDKLTFKVLDDNHSHQDIEKLSSILFESNDARKRYLSLTRQEALLHWEATDCNTHKNTKTTNSRIITFPLITSVAAAVLAMIGIWFFHKNQNNYSSSKIYSNANSTDFSKKVNFDKSIVSKTGINLEKKSYSLHKSFYNESPFVSTRKFFNEAVYGLNILHEKRSYGEGGMVEHFSDITSWKRLKHLEVSSEHGVSPKFGDKMMRFSPLEVSEVGQVAEIAETIQILDIRDLKFKQSDFGKAQLQTRVFFNKGVNLYGDKTKFSVSFHALNSSLSNESQTVAHQKSSMTSDLNPSTWEELNSDFSFPNETEFVVVSMSAQMSGVNALLPNLENHYADGFSINLLVDGEKIVGPL